METQKKKRKPTMSFQVDDELRSKIEAYAKARRLGLSAAIRLLILECLPNGVIISKVDNDKS